MDSSRVFFNFNFYYFFGGDRKENTAPNGEREGGAASADMERRWQQREQW